MPYYKVSASVYRDGSDEALVNHRAVVWAKNATVAAECARKRALYRCEPEQSVGHRLTVCVGTPRGCSPWEARKAQADLDNA